MSIWIHVAGIIRLDKLKGISRINIENAQYILERMVPHGSEGPLKIEVVDHKTTASEVVWASAIITGDLRDRDYDYVKEIIDWITSRTNRLIAKQAVIRQGVLHIEVETGEDVVLLHEYSEPGKSIWKVIE